MNEIKPGRRVVGRDGIPDATNAPWGVRYWPQRGLSNGNLVFVWITPTSYPIAVEWHRDTEWEPLPEPSSEYVSAPEPEPRWSHDRGFIKCSGSPINEAEVNAAVAALNTLDRDGVVYGPGRPMEELPDGDHERVLILGEWGSYIAANTDRDDDSYEERIGWWPLPVPEDTNA